MRTARAIVGLIMAVALAATSIGAKKKKPTFESWTSSPTFEYVVPYEVEIDGKTVTITGNCLYTIFVRGTTPFYWTMNHERMNLEKVQSDSQQGVIPFGYTGLADVRIFLDSSQKYGQPTWQWEHRLECVDYKKPEGGWIGNN